MDTAKRICTYIVWTWLAASLLHGIAHVVSGAPLSPLPNSLLWLGVTVEVFFSLAPLVALVLLYRRWVRSGASLLLLSMLIALLWGYGGHFLFPGGDNLMAHPAAPAAPAFLLTSILVFIIPWAGITAAIYTLVQVRRQTYVSRNVGTDGQAHEEVSRGHVRSQV